MNRPKLAVDTNVFVSATIKFLGAEATVLDLMAKQQVQLYLSDVIYAEYKDVLLRRKLHLDPERVRYVQETIDQNGCQITTSVVYPSLPTNRMIVFCNAPRLRRLITW